MTPLPRPTHDSFKDEDIKFHCPAHSEFKERLDDRWNDSWATQRRINEVIFSHLEKIADKVDANNIGMINAIHAVGLKLVKIMGGITVAGFILTIVASFIGAYLRH